jgi:hypothetical protein
LWAEIRISRSSSEIGGGGGGGGGGALSTHAAVWVAVALSVQVVDVHELSERYGGVQLTTRQVTGPEQAIS